MYTGHVCHGHVPRLPLVLYTSKAINYKTSLEKRHWNLNRKTSATMHSVPATYIYTVLEPKSYNLNI